MARVMKRAAVAVMAVVASVMAAAPAHAVWADNHNQVLVDEQG